jgi:uroporphyrinogen-III synthase
MQRLQGLGVLVTRPELQAMPLCRLLHTEGAETMKLPAIDIRAHGERRALAAALGPLEKFALVIFTSANAVRFGVSLLDQRRDLELAAIGPATARALNQAGYRVAISPHQSIDSEGLLRHPRLTHVAGERVLLVTGANGRQWLPAELDRRGAHVFSACVYERVPASPSAAVLAAVQERFAAGALHVITATSLDIANHLLALVPPGLRGDFERAHWLVPGARIAAGLRERGLQAPLLQADSAEDQDLVAALLRWRSGASDKVGATSLPQA